MPSRSNASESELALSTTPLSRIPLLELELLAATLSGSSPAIGARSKLLDTAISTASYMPAKTASHVLRRRYSKIENMIFPLGPPDGCHNQQESRRFVSLREW